MISRFIRMEAKIRNVESTRDDHKSKVCDRNFISKFFKNTLSGFPCQFPNMST
jgi:hypothetical protein